MDPPASFAGFVRVKKPMHLSFVVFFFFFFIVGGRIALNIVHQAEKSCTFFWLIWLFFSSVRPISSPPAFRLLVEKRFPGCCCYCLTFFLNQTLAEWHWVLCLLGYQTRVRASFPWREVIHGQRWVLQGWNVECSPVAGVVIRQVSSSFLLLKEHSRQSQSTCAPIFSISLKKQGIIFFC